MNSQVTLINEPHFQSMSTANAKGRTRLLYRRSSLESAALYSDDPIEGAQYLLTTSEDGLRRVKIYRAGSPNLLVDVHRRTLLHDTIALPGRYPSKGGMKVDEILKKGPSGSSSSRQETMSVTMYTIEDGMYSWRKGKGRTWALFEQSTSNPIAWTEAIISDRGPTWALIMEKCALGISDYVLACLFYLLGSEASKPTEKMSGCANVEVYAAYASSK